MDNDREDGELSEREHSSQPLTSNLNGRAYPEPPRSVPQTSHVPPLIQEAYNPDRPAAGQQTPHEPVQRGPQQSNSPALIDKIQKDRDDAKQFIKLLNSNNIGYRALAKENLDSELLRGLYQSLNLPSEPAPILPPTVNGASQKLPTHVPAVQQQNSTPAVKTNIAPAPPSKSVASPTAPGDRRDYIARLQAAKMAKQAGAAKPSPPQKTPPAKAVTPAPTVMTPQPATTPTAKQPVTDEQRARNTELIKQRLEAMRAKQKPPVAPTNGTAPSPLSQQLEQSRAAAEPAMQSVLSGTNTPITPAHMPPFPGIPGLFMSNPPAYNHNNSATNTSRLPPSIPQKRPAPSDTDPSTPHAYQEESMIIEVSDDESNGSDMDIDDDQTGPQPATSFQDQRQGPGYLSDFPSRSGSTKPASAISTPGPQTPATLAREKELEDKVKQLAAMKLTLKRKLAEKREKDKAAAAAVATSSPMPQDTSMHVQPSQNDLHSKLSTQTGETGHPVHAHPTNASSTGRDTKRLRRAEIQSRLPSLDAEIATNTSRMAQLTREMEQLMAQNERITKDKEQLTKELESLGIDTEGMSHAELRAKKDELEYEQSPEPEHGVTSATQPSASELPTDSSTPSQKGDTSLADIEGRANATGWPDQRQSPVRYANLPGLGQVAHPVQAASAYFQKPIVDNIPIANDKVISPLDARHPAQRDIPQSGEQDGLAEAQDIVIDMPGAPGTRDSATPLDDDDFYSPAPADMDLAITANANEVRPPQVEAPPSVANSPSEEGEVEMSESEEEEEYEPEESNVITDTPTQDMQEAQAQESGPLHSIATSQASTEDEEDYEPPDVDQDMSGVESDAAVAEPIQEIYQAEPEDGAMDIATSSSEDSDDSDSDEESTPEPETHISLLANNAPKGDTNFADDLAPELQSESVTVVPGSEAVRLPSSRKPD